VPRALRPGVLSTEYVAGGSSLGALYGNAVRALPAPIDDLSADFGIDIYERMALDPQISACLTVLCASILEDGLTLAPAIDDKLDPRYALAVEIAEAAEAMFDGLDTPLDDALWDLLGALKTGNRVAELVYEVKPGPTGRDLLQLRAIKPKPPRATAFVVDAYLNVLGLLGAKPGQVAPPLLGATLDTNSQEILPREKFAIFSFRPKHGDPRGTSILLPAYRAWWRKQQVFVEYLKYLARFASPSLWGTPPEHATTVPATDSLTNITDPSAVPTTPEMALSAAMQAWQNGTVLAAPFGTEIHPVEMQGDGAAFLRAVAECDHAITKTILTQQLATEEGAHQARAAAQVHQDVLDTLVRQGKRSLIRVVARDILHNWVRWNWGDDALAVVPKLSLGTTEQQDLPAMMTAIAALVKVGYLHVSQYAATDSMLNLPARDLTQDEQVAPADPNTEPDQASKDGTAPADQTNQQGQPPAKPEPSAPGRVPVRPHERNAPARRQPPKEDAA
jgi:hypothetical protein